MEGDESGVPRHTPHGGRRLVSRSVVLGARGLLAVTAVVVAIIVFMPGPPDEAAQLRLARWLDQLHGQGLPAWISFALVEFLSNVVMFLPLGFLGYLAVPRRTWVVMPTLMLLSAAIEITQTLALPRRDGTVQDVVANTLGAVLGWLLAHLLLRHRATSPAPEPLRHT